MRRRSTVSIFLLVTALALPASAQDDVKPPDKERQITLAGAAERITHERGGRKFNYYLVGNERGLDLRVNGPMTLLLGVRPVLGAEDGSTARLIVTVSDGTSVTADIPVDSNRAIQMSDGSRASVRTIVRVPVEAANARVKILLAAGQAAVALGRAAYEGPAGATATADTGPSITEPDLGAIPILIRQRVERIGIIARSATIIPLEPGQQVGSGFSNVLVGAELRWTIPTLERRNGILLDVSTYRSVSDLRTQAVLPVGGSIESTVRRTAQVTPVMIGTSYRQTVGDRRALFAAVAGGASFVAIHQEADGREPLDESETVWSAVARVGYEQRLGPGQLAGEIGYLHIDAVRPYVGGATAGLHYRFVF